MIACVDCGVRFKRLGSNRKRCGECVKNRKVICVDCGVEVERTGNCQKRCVDCRPIAAKRYSREYGLFRRTNAPEREARRHARYYAMNRDRHAEYGRRRHSENPERAKEYRRRIRQRDALVPTPRQGAAWTPAEDALVLSWVGGLRELGAALGRSRIAVKSRKRRLRTASLID